MANAQPHPAIGLAKMGVDRAQAVVAGMAAAGLDPGLAGGKVKLVMKDHDSGGVELVEIRRRAHRLAGQVHEGFGLEQHHLFGAKPPFADQPLKALAPGRKAVVGGDAVQRHEADVVAVAGIFAAGIAKAHKEFHRFRPAAACRF